MNSEGVTNVRSTQVRRRALLPVRPVFGGPQHVFDHATANVSLPIHRRSSGLGSADTYCMCRLKTGT